MPGIGSIFVHFFRRLQLREEKSKYENDYEREVDCKLYRQNLSGSNQRVIRDVYFFKQICGGPTVVFSRNNLGKDFRLGNGDIPRILPFPYVPIYPYLDIHSCLIVSGELRSRLYFYSLGISDNDYIFYSCDISDKSSLKYEIIGNTIARNAHFAVQQPYFIRETAEYIESFNVDIIPVEFRLRLIRPSQAFFVHRNIFFIVSNEHDTKIPKASASNYCSNTVNLSIPVSTPLPHSVYAEDFDLIYLLCGDSLLILDSFSLDVQLIKIGCCTPFTSLSVIAGVMGDMVLINAHWRLISLNPSKMGYTHRTVKKRKGCISSSFFENVKQEELPPLPPLHRSNPEKDHESTLDTGYTSESKNSTREENVPESLENIEKHIGTISKVRSIVNKFEQKANPSRLQRIPPKKIRLPTIPVLQSPQKGVNTNDYSSKYANEFTVNQILGVGGCGIVYEAANVFDHWRYAVKRIPASERDIEKTLREVQVMAQFDHPGIVRYNSTWIEKPPEGWQARKLRYFVFNLNIDYETLRRFPSSGIQISHNTDKTVFIYMQMQLCEYSLNEWLKRQGSTARELSRIRSWFKQIVSAVAYIHDKGLIHRDLKPSNILFADHNTLKICDLGIATSLAVKDGQEVSRTNSNIGTPLYMAPEQGSIKYSSKVDVFSLRLILTELCVIMDKTERESVFANYRSGKENTILKDQPDTEKFVSWLTQTDYSKRPTCREMLNHSFLA